MVAEFRWQRSGSYEYKKRYRNTKRRKDEDVIIDDIVLVAGYESNPAADTEQELGSDVE